MSGFRAQRHGVAVGSRPHHLERNVREVAVHADEDARFDLVVPNGQIGVAGIDHGLGVDLGIDRPVIRHRNDLDARDLRREFQHHTCLLLRVLIPSPDHERPRKDRGVPSGQHVFRQRFERDGFGNEHALYQALAFLRKHHAHRGGGGRQQSLGAGKDLIPLGAGCSSHTDQLLSTCLTVLRR
jgi:hypothetical protein